MAINKVVYNTKDGEQVLMDLTGDTVTPETLAVGATAHDASGKSIEGILNPQDGKSSYEIWIENGNTGTEQDFLDSLKGEDGYTPVKGTDYFTEADKAEIIQAVINAIGTPLFGTVDSDNNIILSGKLADGTYTIKYEMEDGSTVDIGSLELDNNVYYTIKNNLTNCTTNNNTLQIVEGQSYSATITANDGYELKSVLVTMGGTSVSVANGNIDIANVTGNIVITAVAEAYAPSYTNLADTKSADWVVDSRFSSSGVVTAASGTNAHISNYIPISRGSVVRVKGMSLTSKIGSSACRQALYTLDGTNKVFLAVADTSSVHSSYVLVDGNGVSTITISDDLITTLAINYEPKLIRLNGVLTGTKEDVIITVDEEI